MYNVGLDMICIVFFIPKMVESNYFILNTSMVLLPSKHNKADGFCNAI